MRVNKKGRCMSLFQAWMVLCLYLEHFQLRRECLCLLLPPLSWTGSLTRQPLFCQFRGSLISNICKFKGLPPESRDTSGVNKSKR